MNDNDSDMELDRNNCCDRNGCSDKNDCVDCMCSSSNCVGNDAEEASLSIAMEKVQGFNSSTTMRTLFVRMEGLLLKSTDDEESFTVDANSTGTLTAKIEDSDGHDFGVMQEVKEIEETDDSGNHDGLPNVTDEKRSALRSVSFNPCIHNNGSHTQLGGNVEHGAERSSKATMTLTAADDSGTFNTFILNDSPAEMEQQHSQAAGNAASHVVMCEEGEPSQSMRIVTATEQSSSSEPELENNSHTETLGSAVDATETTTSSATITMTTSSKLDYAPGYLYLSLPCQSRHRTKPNSSRVSIESSDTPFDLSKSQLMESVSTSSSSNTSPLPTELPFPPQHRRPIPNQCAICLCEYELGDTIVISCNVECPHAFHQECILEWLVKVQEGTPCPCCRRTFVDLEKSIPQSVRNTNNNNNNDGVNGDRNTNSTVSRTTVSNVNTTTTTRNDGNDS